jgi:hypothetical protein
MNLTWIKMPYLNIEYITTKLYGSRSRIYTIRLRRKISSIEPFEPWEIDKLNLIKKQMLEEMNPSNAQPSILKSSA